MLPQGKNEEDPSVYTLMFYYSSQLCSDLKGEKKPTTKEQKEQRRLHEVLDSFSITAWPQVEDKTEC